MIDLIYKEQTYQIRGLIYEVHNRLGVGWDEESYHQATVEVFKASGVPVESKVRKIITHRGVEVDRFECDLVVWDLIILELKVLPYTNFAPIHFAQLGHYLKVWNKRLGLLVNFGGEKAKIERVLWKQPERVLTEDLSAIEGLATNRETEIIGEIRKIVCNLEGQFRLGLPETFWRKLFIVEAKFQGLRCQTELKIPVIWETKKLSDFTSNHYLIEQKLLLNIRALLNHPTQYDFLQMKTFLNTLNLPVGIMVNFGKNQLQIYGVNSK